MEELKKFIQDKDYESATKYLVSNQELSAPIKTYNLGAVAYAQGDFVSARFYFEKANGSGLKSLELKKSLDTVKKDLNLYQLEQEYGVRDNIVLASMGYEREVSLSVIALLFLCLIVSLIKVKEVFIGFFSILVILCGCYSFYLSDFKLQINQAQSKIYEGPSKALDVVGEILPGQKLIITEKKENWVFIEYPLMFQGWVYKHEAKDL